MLKPTLEPAMQPKAPLKTLSIWIWIYVKSKKATNFVGNLGPLVEVSAIYKHTEDKTLR